MSNEDFIGKLAFCRMKICRVKNSEHEVGESAEPRTVCCLRKNEEKCGVEWCRRNGRYRMRDQPKKPRKVAMSVEKR